ncbi:MAG: hypothetical protein ACKVQU_19870 [Burkholderiales bacterium]
MMNIFRKPLPAELIEQTTARIDTSKKSMLDAGATEPIRFVALGQCSPMGAQAHRA